MSLVCHVCLRHTEVLRSLGEQSDLIDLYEDLCPNEYESLYYKFCTECIAKLKKCQDFKIQCNLAKKIFDSWKRKKSNRGSVLELYRDMPTSKLSYCNRKNFKVYFYHTPDVASSASIQTYNSHPHIITVNIPQDDINTDKDTTSSRIVTDNDDKIMELCGDDEIKVELPDDTGFNYDEGLSDDELKTEFTNTDDMDAGEIRKEIVDKNMNDKSAIHNKLKRSSDEQGLSDDEGPIDDETNGLSDDELTDDEAFESDSDKSFKDVIRKLKTIPKRPNVTKAKNVKQKPTNIKKRCKERDINRYEIRSRTLDQFKKEMKKKITEIGVVKDYEGNDVDFDKILDNVDKLTIKDIRTCRQIINEEVFNYENVQRLCEVQSKYIEYASVFDIYYFKNIDEVKEEFSRRHEHADYVNSKFRCEDCFKGFKNQNKFDIHRRTGHNPANQFSCDICKMTFVSKVLMLKHRQNLHSTVYRCKICSYTVTNKGYMEQHYRIHNGLKYTCKYCSAEFRRNCQRYAHMTKHHNITMAQCQLCAYSTHSPKGLISHQKRMHPNEKFVVSECNRKCDKCNITFINDEVYQIHLLRKHTPGSENNQTSLKRSKRSKMPRVLICRVCNDTGSSPTWLVKHFRDVHPNESLELVYRHKKRYLCDECGKAFLSKPLWEGHMNVHKNVRPFECPNAKCSRAFHTKQKLVIHMERHEPPKHECKECGKKFRSQPNLYSHSMIHKQDKCHICEYCSKGFVLKAMLNEHVRGVHMHIKRKRKTDPKPEIN